MIKLNITAHGKHVYLLSGLFFLITVLWFFLILSPYKPQDTTKFCGHLYILEAFARPEKITIAALGGSEAWKTD